MSSRFADRFGGVGRWSRARVARGYWRRGIRVYYTSLAAVTLAHVRQVAYWNRLC